MITNEQQSRIYALYNECEWSKDDSPGKLLLTPLEKITDEHAIFLANLHDDSEPWTVVERKGDYMILECEHEQFYIWFDCDFVSACTIDGKMDNIIHDVFSMMQYTIQQGYAMPLFIEPGHPDNGKTAITLGLAIDKTLTLTHAPHPQTPQA